MWSSALAAYILPTCIFTQIRIGQFGVVYKGIYRKSADRKSIEVAIKTIKANRETGDFMKEMKVMSRLIHPNIVRFHGLVHHQGNFK